MPTMISLSSTKITLLPTFAGALLACGLFVAPTLAGPNRTFVSGHGTDGGTCNFAAPCRSFAFALGVTNAGGEIDVLDPAGYGMVTINKAISIVNDGVGTAGITAGSTLNGVTINAGASDSVHLRGLTIEGLGTGSNGILFNSGGNLAIENCVVRNFTLSGIQIAPNTPSSFSVSNTNVSNNSTNFGIFVNPSGSAVVKGVLSKVITNNDFVGIWVDGRSTAGASLDVTIVDSVASNNIAVGVTANSASGHPAAAVALRNVVVSNNGAAGLDAEPNAIFRIAHSVFTGNGSVAGANGGTIFSYGDNDIDGNTNNNTGVLTVIPPH